MTLIATSRHGATAYRLGPRTWHVIVGGRSGVSYPTRREALAHLDRFDELRDEEAARQARIESLGPRVSINDITEGDVIHVGSNHGQTWPRFEVGEIRHRSNQHIVFVTAQSPLGILLLTSGSEVRRAQPK